MPFIVTLKIPTMADLANVPEEYITSLKMEGHSGPTSGNTRWHDGTMVKVVSGSPARYGPLIRELTETLEGSVLSYGAVAAKITDMDATVKASQVRAEMKNGGCLELA